ncbi:MAG: type IV pilin-like G/H family protein [Cyanobacteria bacterium P01_F01_bin.86]
MRVQVTTCYAVLAVLLWQTEMLAGESSWPTQPLQVVSRQDNQADLLEQLLGVWEFRTPDCSVVGTGIFTAEGIFWDLSKPGDAIRFTWKFDFTQPEPQVVVEIGEALFIGSLSASEMQMQVVPLLDDDLLQADQELTVLAQKLSSDTQLPEGIRMIGAVASYQEEANFYRQLQARTTISSIHRSQQFYFYENQEFISDMQVLEIYSDTVYQSENYEFQIVLSEEGQVANTLALPKTDSSQPNTLRTYLGRVAFPATPESLLTPTLVCESIAPTQEIPTFPNYPMNSLTCPEGYEVVD